MNENIELGELITLQRRPIEKKPDEEYSEIGIFCFGKGIFHKPPKKGWEFGSKNIYSIKKDDLIFQITFAWEGAIALASEKEDNKVGSVRYPTFVVDKNKCLPKYLLYYFYTREGLKKIREISPGSALRNRVLNTSKLLKLNIPLLSIEKQYSIVQQIELTQKGQLELLSNIDNMLNVNLHQLKQKILQKAVSGKLVPQDSNDDPASDTLKKIKGEKERLIKEKKIRKEKSLLPIEKDDVPFELPDGWIWTRLGNTSISYTNDIVDGPFGSNLKASEYTNKGIPIIRIQNVSRNKFINKNIKFVTVEKANQLKRHNYKSGDIVINKLGDPVGEACIVPDNIEPGIFVADIVRFRPNNYINSKYFMYMINSPLVIQQFYKQSKGTTRQRVRLTQFRDLIVAIPPLNEQKHIVEKVNYLMKLCDELEQKIKESQKNGELLMDAALRDAFEN